MIFEGQYPDILVREGETKEQGLPCRFVPSKGTGLKKVKDGVEVDVSYVIAFPEDTPQLLIGELVTAYDERGNVIVWQEPIALFHHGSFHYSALKYVQTCFRYDPYGNRTGPKGNVR